MTLRPLVASGLPWKSGVTVAGLCKRLVFHALIQRGIDDRGHRGEILGRERVGNISDDSLQVEHLRHRTLHRITHHRDREQFGPTGHLKQPSALVKRVVEAKLAKLLQRYPSHDRRIEPHAVPREVRIL
jgi:hypothetical protein